MMAGIRSKNTMPELIVRKTLHRLGFRFRLHVKKLPGCPDIVLAQHRTIIQIKGCFWHLHRCIGARLPVTNRHYWTPKLKGNKLRDQKNERKLRRLGWAVKTIWECNLERYSKDQLETVISRYLKESA